MTPALFFAIVSSLAATPPPAEPLLGFLEEGFGTDGRFQRFRLAFARSPEGWRPYVAPDGELRPQDYPEALVFTTAPLVGPPARVETTRPEAIVTSADVGLLRIARIARAPRAVEGAATLRDFRGARLVAPVPAMTRPGRKQRGWTRVAKPPQQLVARAVAALDAKLREAPLCQNGSRPAKPYEPGNLQLARRDGYRGPQGWLVALAADRELYGCGGLDGPLWSTQWYWLRGAALTELGGELELVGSGDYDRDGATETVFWLSGYNRDGYVLFADGFARRVELTWSYH